MKKNTSKKSTSAIQPSGVSLRQPVGARLKNRRLKRRAQKADAHRRHIQLSGSFRLFRDSVSLVRQHWKLFGGITLVYFLMSLVLIGGLGGDIDVREFRSSLGPEFGQLAASIALYGVLIGSAGGTASEAGAAYQTIVIIIVSLAVIWTLRQLLGGVKVELRDSFYKSMTPLVPFVIVLIVLGVMLIPAMIGSFLFNTIYSGSLAIGLFEIIGWGVIILLLLVWSLRLLTTYIFALYIVTLPDMRPFAAIKASRNLVRFRRLRVLRKLLFLPLVYLVLGAVVLIPLIFLLPVIVQWVFVPLSLFALVFAHVYIYSLYKEML